VFGWCRQGHKEFSPCRDALVNGDRDRGVGGGAEGKEDGPPPCTGTLYRWLPKEGLSTVGTGEVPLGIEKRVCSQGHRGQPRGFSPRTDPEPQPAARICPISSGRMEEVEIPIALDSGRISLTYYPSFSKNLICHLGTDPDNCNRNHSHFLNLCHSCSAQM
jgi:hypothetical protein